MRHVNMYIYQTLSRRIQIYNVFKCSEVEHYNVFKMLACLSRQQYNVEYFSRASTWVLVLVLVLVILVLEMLLR